MNIEEVYDIAFNAFRNALNEKLATPESDVSIAPKFRQGKLVITPADPAHQAKEIDIDVFFKKIVSLRNNLRVLEQKVNSSNIAEGEKVELQGYITKCYGSLTTFNVLFQENAAKFVGQKGE
ncbi:MAG TPA: hypothetical protein VFA55_09725 [Candidatus Kapabacteria bacterium]|nr:hypothetical protein [Candidatus Kapabacteria bacterium]